MTVRPFAQVRNWTWKHQDRSETPGIGIFHGNRIQIHLTPAEARAMADRLHDMADRIDAQATQEITP